MVKPLSILSKLSMEIKTNLSPALIGYCLYSNVVLEHCTLGFIIGACALYTTRFLQILLLKKRHFNFLSALPNFFINYAFLENMLKL